MTRTSLSARPGGSHYPYRRPAPGNIHSPAHRQPARLGTRTRSVLARRRRGRVSDLCGPMIIPPPGRVKLPINFIRRTIGGPCRAREGTSGREKAGNRPVFHLHLRFENRPLLCPRAGFQEMPVVVAKAQAADGLCFRVPFLPLAPLEVHGTPGGNLHATCVTVAGPAQSSPDGVARRALSRWQEICA